MDPRVNFITFATRDLDAARAFYRDGFGWKPLADVPGEIVFFQVGPAVVLGLFDSIKFNDDLGRQAHDISISGVTLSQNVDGPAEVDKLVSSAVSAGAAVLKVPQEAAFGGYHGLIVDPNGVIWEIAHNPGWSIGADGAIALE